MMLIIHDRSCKGMWLGNPPPPRKSGQQTWKSAFCIDSMLYKHLSHSTIDRNSVNVNILFFLINARKMYKMLQNKIVRLYTLAFYLI